MRKKTLALFLTCVLAAGMLAGCGNKDDKKDAAPAENNTEVNVDDTAKKDDANVTPAPESTAAPEGNAAPDAQDADATPNPADGEAKDGTEPADTSKPADSNSASDAGEADGDQDQPSTDKAE